MIGHSLSSALLWQTKFYEMGAVVRMVVDSIQSNAQYRSITSFRQYQCFDQVCFFILSTPSLTYTRSNASRPIRTQKHAFWLETPEIFETRNCRVLLLILRFITKLFLLGGFDLTYKSIRFSLMNNYKTLYKKSHQPDLFLDFNATEMKTAEKEQFSN